MARCLATIANGGNVYDVHIVDSVLDASGNTIFKNEPKLLNRIDAPMEYWEAVREGMKGVVSPRTEVLRQAHGQRSLLMPVTLRSSAERQAGANWRDRADRYS